MTVVAPDPSSDDTDPPAADPTREPAASDAAGTGAAESAADRAKPARGARNTLPYFPALDGLRGVAVGGVLLFHAGFTWMEGGFLGVSTFFTLSGFLITSLLLAERGATARLDLRAFWTRRFRRLMPAALAALAFGVLYAVMAGDAVQKRNLAGDVIACLAYIANWRFIFSSQSYADVLGAPSPVLQFWSLAIEEQFYLLFPLLAFAVLHHYDKTRRWFGGVLAALVCVSIACTLWLGLSHDAVYYGTETRAAELLIGALLAIGLYDRRVTARLARDHLVRNSAAFLGAVALIGCVALWNLTSLQTNWLYRGGFVLYAGLTSLVIVAAMLPTGPLRAVLAFPALRGLGRISYGVYLYHWPVFLWLSEINTGWSVYALFVPRLLLTFALAILSYRYLELPVRQGKGIFHVRPVRLAPYAIGALVVAVVAVTLTAPKPPIDFESAAAQLQEQTADQGPAPTIDVKAAEPPFPRIAVFGDSTALMTGFGLNDWARQTKQADFVDSAAWLGCGIGRGGDRRDPASEGPIPEECNHWERNWAQKVRNAQPNIALVQIGPWEVADRKLAGDNTWRYPGDPVYDDFLAKEMVLAVDTLSAQGADVIWLTSPEIGAGSQGKDERKVRGNTADPARMRRINELINQLPQQRPGKVHVVDLAGWLASTGEDTRLRQDGVHFGPAESKEVAERWLGPTVVSTYRADWKARHDLEVEIASGKAGNTTTTGAGTTVPTPGTDPAAPDTTPDVTGAPTTSAFNGPKRKLLVFGDAAAQPIGDALKAWGDKTGALEVATIVDPNCGLQATTTRIDKDTREPTPASCGNFVLALLQGTVNFKPDMVLIVPSVWDLTDNQLTGETALRGIGDKTYEDALWLQYTKITQQLEKVDVVTMWMNYPTITWGKNDQPPPASPHPASDPARIKRVDELLIELARTTAYAQRVDFAGFASRWPTDAGVPTLLPDGVNVGAEAEDRVGDWLGNEVLVHYDEFQASGQKK